MGAFAVLRAAQGKIDVVAQGTASGLQTFPAPVLPLDPGMRQLYTDRLGTFPADVNATPHFPTAAALAREMYRLRSGQTVDGVVATDPVALSYLLPATGPITAGSGTRLTPDNAVRLLLSEVYSQIASHTEQDQFFAEIARTILDRLSAGPMDSAAAVAGLSRAAAERRILVWSADPAEQALLSDTVLGGSLPEEDAAAPIVGLFLNDGTGAKLGYYLTRSTEIRPGACLPDGRRELTISLTLGLAAPATGLSDVVTGDGTIVPLYTLRTIVMSFSPAKGAIVSARRDGASVPLGTGIERGRAVGVVGVDLTPGTTTTVEMTVLTGVPPADAAGTFTPTLWTTPGVRNWPSTVEPTTFCPRPS